MALIITGHTSLARNLMNLKVIQQADNQIMYRAGGALPWTMAAFPYNGYQWGLWNGCNVEETCS